MDTTTFAPVNGAVLGPPGRRTVLDDAHVGDIRGALGTLRQHAHLPRSRRHRLLALLAIMGPGLIVMVGDNDAGGVATYAQAGQNYRLTLLWTLLLLIPVLIVNQEMVVRLGAVTGVGHARLIIERFGRFWGAFSVGDLFILNFLTIVTEFIGVTPALGYFGVSKYVCRTTAGIPAGSPSSSNASFRASGSVITATPAMPRVGVCKHQRLLTQSPRLHFFRDRWAIRRGGVQ